MSKIIRLVNTLVKASINTNQQQIDNYHVKDLGFYDMKIIPGFGANETCVQLYSNNEKSIVKSIVYFNFNFKKDMRITLNSLKQVNYDCINDLKIIANSIVYKRNY